MRRWLLRIVTPLDNVDMQWTVRQWVPLPTRYDVADTVSMSIRTIQVGFSLINLLSDRTGVRKHVSRIMFFCWLLLTVAPLRRCARRVVQDSTLPRQRRRRARPVQKASGLQPPVCRHRAVTTANRATAVRPGRARHCPVLLDSSGPVATGRAHWDLTVTLHPSHQRRAPLGSSAERQACKTPTAPAPARRVVTARKARRLAYRAAPSLCTVRRGVLVPSACR